MSMRPIDIDAMLAEGIAFATIEERIEQASAPVAVKDLLWLYAWVWQSRDCQREIISEMVAQLT